jgi:ribosome-associated translation inhibitor RaiA
MTFPIQITFRHMLPSRVFEERIRQLAERLEKFSPRITSCHVVVEKPHQSRAQGGLFDVHVSVCVPGNIVVVRRSHNADPEHSNAWVALRDAFSAAKRNLQDYEKVARGAVKSRAPRPVATEANAH